MPNWIWSPEQEFAESTNVWRFMQRLGFDDREKFLAWSRNDNERFWEEIAREMGIAWFRPYRQVLDSSQGVEWSQWFCGGRLNIAHNCLDRHLNETRDAVIWRAENGERRALTFPQIHALAGKIANALTVAGLKTGDRVAICMPMVPEVVAILYACLKQGIIMTPIFSGFGTAAIAARLEDSGARVLFTSDSIERRGKRSPLKTKIDEALLRPNTVEKVVVCRYRCGDLTMGARDVWWDDFIEGQSSEAPTLELDSEARSMLLYTSGTTGRPKGAVHTHAGALIKIAMEIFIGFDHKPADRFFWLSDIGWMMGPWTIIGNHCFGGTIFLYDGAPDYPDSDCLWRILAEESITTFGISPTAIRLLMRASHPECFPLDSVRLLGSTGEPWDDTSYEWYFRHVGRGKCPVINISGGTELVGSLVFPLPIQSLKPSTVGAPAPGMATAIVDDQGRPVEPGRTGHLVCTKPAPSMTRGVWNNPQRYLETYWSRFPGYWDHGDWASMDEDGCWFIYGRSDESMNVAGRKVGPAEIEEALIEHPAVSEAAVIGVPDPVKGEGIVAFVVLTAPVAEGELAKHLITTMGATFRPNAIHAVSALPKTQSGKVVRRLIRRKYLGEALGDTSTVENPALLEAFSSAETTS